MLTASKTSQGISQQLKLFVMLQEANGGAGVYSADLRKAYLLMRPEWKHDIVPEIINGHNVMDFVDPDIEARLIALEREEEQLAKAADLEVCP